MTKPKLKTRLWAVAKEYAEKTSVIIDRDIDFWIAEEVSVSSCCFWDDIILSLEEMQIIIDHLSKWLKKYRSLQKIGEVVLEWFNWSLENAYDAQKDKFTDHPRINLWSWLNGLRPEDLKER